MQALCLIHLQWKNFEVFWRKITIELQQQQRAAKFKEQKPLFDAVPTNSMTHAHIVKSNSFPLQMLALLLHFKLTFSCWFWLF